jgi:dTDP-4-dehydrorhamnose reductase
MTGSGRWLVTGAAGQLGHHLVARLRAADVEVLALTRSELDITSAADVDTVIRTQRPDVVVNAAAYTAVDAAESDEAAAAHVNGAGPGLLAEALARRGGRLIQVSTDYVFDGTGQTPYEPDHPAAPQTAYGRTKYAGEQAVRAALPDRSVVVRTAWVHGGPSANFVDTMLRLEKERPSLDVVADQVGSPTWAGDLAAALIELGRSDVLAGTLHYVNGGQASWFDLARATFALVGADEQRIRPVTTAAFPRPAPRPAWSVLSTRSWTDRGLTEPREWEQALAESVAALTA